MSATTKNISGQTPDPRDWHWADIKAALEKAGYSLAGLSKANGCKTRRAAGMAKDRPYPRMERLISEAIGVPPQLIWPSRYDPNGNPIRKPGRPKTFPSEMVSNNPAKRIQRRGLMCHGSS